MKVCFCTLGCKVNQYETRAISEDLKRRGYEIVTDESEADIYIVNSCTVTAEADRKTRQSVRRIKRSHPNSLVILTGCMPQAYPKDALVLPEADIVTGNKLNRQIPRLIDEYMREKKRILSVSQHETGDPYYNTNISSFDGRTRADIKIQDGCNRFCSYCIIPTSRGRVRSKPLEELRKELDNIAAAGYAEVVLVGINLSSYGSDIGTDFPSAVEEACKTDGIKRVRLGSLEPDHLTDEVIERLSKCKKLCPQFHISLQSGCNKTLRDMRRHYTAEEYYALCENLRKHFPGCALTTDVMVGFPMETEADFEENLEFVKKVGFQKVHVFPYSLRPGTKAALMNPQVEKKEKERRCKIMIAETEKIRRAYLKSRIGTQAEVLFESKVKDGFISGYTDNYTPVRIKSETFLYNEIHRVKITGLCEDDFCLGEII